MSNYEKNPLPLYLGVDGGQSHTEALVADSAGNILGRGLGGASNHAEIPGGRERLRNAVFDSVSEALKTELELSIGETVFASAHFGMTGGAEYKLEIIEKTINAEILNAGHDAPTALFGATAGRAGIIVIAGTGSVVFGQNEVGETARAGGLGYLFSDEGSGFWLAAQTIRLAIKETDKITEADGLADIVKQFFNVKQIRQVTDAFYNGKISRDEIAKLARVAHDAAADGNKTLDREIRYGCKVLVKQVKAVAAALNLPKGFPVSGVGGMFGGKLFKKYFTEILTAEIPQAEYTEPFFGPAAGALLMSYRAGGVEINRNLLDNLQKSQSK